MRPAGRTQSGVPAVLANKPQDGVAQPADGGDTARGGVCRAIEASAQTPAGDLEVNPFDAIAARMESFAGAMSEGDGVRIFNGLYLAVTRAVGAEFANDRFEDPAFFARLASVFAQLYFDAVESDAAKRPVSRVWAPLFEKRLQAGIAPLQFAMAGMNAHINYDLAIALVATTREFGYDLRLDSAHHRDHVVARRSTHVCVNVMLARVMEEVKEHFETGLVRTVVKAVGTVDQFRSIERARDNAWMRAQNLMALDGAPFIREPYRLVLVRAVGLASRTLLYQNAARETRRLRRRGEGSGVRDRHPECRCGRWADLAAVVRARRIANRGQSRRRCASRRPGGQEGVGDSAWMVNSESKSALSAWRYSGLRPPSSDASASAQPCHLKSDVSGARRRPGRLLRTCGR